MINFNWKIIRIVMLLSFMFQFILIGHRVSFDFNLIKFFLNENAGLNESIYSNRRYALHINYLIKKFKLKDYNLDEKLIENSNDQPIIEVTYPIKYSINSSSYFVLNKSLTIDYYDMRCDLIEKFKTISYYECIK